MKNYIAPEMEIVNFKAVDILTASGTPAPSNLSGKDESQAPTVYANSVPQFSDVNTGAF